MWQVLYQFELALHKLVVVSQRPRMVHVDGGSRLEVCFPVQLGQKVSRTRF